MANARPDAATAVVNVRVLPGRDKDFLAWQHKMNEAVSQFAGFVSTDVVTPSDPVNDDFVIIYQFATPWQLKAWMDSPERQHMLQRFETSLVGPESTTVVVGGTDTQVGPEPVTALITVRVRVGADQPYREWQGRMAELMARQRGHLGTHIQEPIRGLQDDWVIMSKFDTEEHLSAWINSRARAQMLGEIQPLIETSSIRKARTSFDGWFPFVDGTRPPRAWQQSALVLLTLFPIVCLELVFVDPLLAWLLPAPATFVGNVISVALTGFIFVPLAAAAFRWWLVPNASRTRMWAGGLILIAGYAVSIVAMQLLFDHVTIAPFRGFG